MNIDFLGNINSDGKQEEELRNAAESFRKFVDAYTSVGFTREEAIQITISMTIGMLRGAQNDKS